MKIYHYNDLTGEYIGQTEAKLDPIEKKPLLPAHATTLKPPMTEANQAARFNAGAWELVPDFRGVKGYDTFGEHHEVTEINVMPDPNWTDTYTPPPPTPAEQLAATDASTIRLIEDLTDVLIGKGIIAATDLPQAAQDKLNNRKALRAKL